jgi:hypothetical protein
MNQQLLGSLIEEKQHESLLIISLFELKCVILQQYRLVDLNLFDDAVTGVCLWISVPETFEFLSLFGFNLFNFLLLPNRCEAPLPATYQVWWQQIQKCLVAVMCANWWRFAKGPNDPDLLILTTYIRQ